MPSNFDIEITDGSLSLDVEIGPTEEIGIDLTDPIPTFNALTGPGLKGSKGDPGATYETIIEVFSNQLQDGVNVHFALANEATAASTIQVFRNGLMEVFGLGYTATKTHVTFTSPPLDSDIIAVVYEKVQ